MSNSPLLRGRLQVRILPGSPPKPFEYKAFCGILALILGLTF